MYACACVCVYELSSHAKRPQDCANVEHPWTSARIARMQKPPAGTGPSQIFQRRHVHQSCVHACWRACVRVYVYTKRKHLLMMARVLHYPCAIIVFGVQVHGGGHQSCKYGQTLALARADWTCCSPNAQRIKGGSAAPRSKGQWPVLVRLACLSLCS